MTTNQDLTLTRGDSLPLAVKVTNTDGSVRDITGATITVTVKHGYGDLDSAAVFQSTGSPTNPTQGQSVATIPGSATELLAPNLSVLVYDVEVTESNGAVTTIQTGKLTVTADVSAL